MATYYTSNDIIESAKRRAAIPENQRTFQEEDFLAFMNEEMSLGLVPSVMRMKEDYLMRTVDVSLVEGQTRYDIPYRAIGNKLREVSFKDSNGNIYELTRVGVGDRPYYNSPNNPSQVYAYYVENNQLVFIASGSTSTGSLQITYYERPNELVLLESVGIISNIDTTTGDISISNFPTNFSSSATYDLISIRSPHNSMAIDLVPTSVNSTTKVLTFTASELPIALRVGDHLALATQSAIPQIPSDLHVVLAHRVAARCLEAQGDMEGLQAANQKLAEFEQNTTDIIDDRIEDAPKKIVNRHGALRSGLSSRRFRR